MQMLNGLGCTEALVSIKIVVALIDIPLWKASTFSISKLILNHTALHAHYLPVFDDREMLSNQAESNQAYYRPCQQDYQANSTWWQLIKYAIVFDTRLLLELWN